MTDNEFCPRCGSENVEQDPEDGDYTVCKDCTYRWTRNDDGEARTEEEMDEEVEEAEQEEEDDEDSDLILGGGW
jgi:uncharacterized Zn finger protein (UPF0148 family)